MVRCGKVLLIVGEEERFQAAVLSLLNDALRSTCSSSKAYGNTRDMPDPVNELPITTASTGAQDGHSPLQLSSHPTQAEFDEAASLPALLSDESVRLDTQSWDRLSALATQIIEQSKLNELYLVRSSIWAMRLPLTT